jgi:hypothetical protein
MKYQRYLLMALMAMVAICAAAQNKKAKTKAVAKATAETPAHKLFQAMLPATAKVMFIDSVVVAKNDFLSHFPLPEEAGKLSVKSKGIPMLAQYENEFGDRRFFASGDTTATLLNTQSLLANEWGKPTVLSDISASDYPMQNFPFLASDGFTLYFSATGPNSLGGRDIFMTTFDSDKGAWYAPQNYGLPFNSAANDYLLAIDDVDTLGWLVSDRYQPADSVCIYTFVPTKSRLDYAEDNLSNAQLERMAKLVSIKDTWAFGNRKEALARRNATLTRKPSSAMEATGILFVIDDQHVITSPSQFKTKEGRQLFAQLQELSQLTQHTETSLDNNRLLYQQRKDKTLAAKIIQQEKDLRQQQSDYRILEKRIRLAEKQ